MLDLAATTGKLVMRWPDPLTVFKGPLGMEKRAAWSAPVDLKDVKIIGKTFHSTVNDVLLTAVTGALGHYIDSRGGATEDMSIRGFIPVNLRPIQLDEELGNKFGLVFLSLPIGMDDPIERLRRIKHNMDELKSSSEPVATFGVINLLGAVPSWIEEIAVGLFDSKGTTVMTNVPGPQAQLYLAGAPIETVMAWVPQSGRIALGVSIISYNGKVWLGVATDKGLIPDPEVIITFFHAEFDEMRSRAQTAQAERQEYLQPMLSMLDKAMQILDELLAQAGKD
jgi:WS/DGAT/MGAT family acyltransferase